MYDVMIVGAGPVGLFLAVELNLQGRDVLVVDKLPAPTGLSKALGVQGAGVRLLRARGLLDRFAQDTLAPPPNMRLHFAGIPLNEPSDFLFAPQARVEGVLADRLAELGTRPERGTTLVRLAEHEGGVEATLRTPTGDRIVICRYLVGCDGGSSTVRKLADIAFPGTEPTALYRLGDVRLPGVEVTRTGLRLGDGTGLPHGIAVPIDDGYFRVVTREPYPTGFDRNAPFALGELEEAVLKTSGVSLPMAEPRWLSRFTDASRQAAAYRKGRVFLAGDAAHIHLPAGGPGISTGLNDAANLAWRLNAVLEGRQSESWLDGYDDERRPAGAQVIEHTMVQGALMNRVPQSQALRSMFSQLVSLPEARRFLARRVQGIDVRYGNDPNPLVGGWMPEEVDLSRGRFVLFSDRCNRREDRWLDIRKAAFGEMLIRPDGFVAWAGDGDVAAAVDNWVGLRDRMQGPATWVTPSGHGDR